jgi:hypothetical protein
VIVIVPPPDGKTLGDTLVIAGGGGIYLGIIVKIPANTVLPF